MADDCGASTTMGLSDPTNLPRNKRQEDSSNDGVTSKDIVADKEERVEPMIHLPLPNVFKSKSEVYRARQRFTPLEVENLRVAVQYYINTYTLVGPLFSVHKLESETLLPPPTRATFMFSLSHFQFPYSLY